MRTRHFRLSNFLLAICSLVFCIGISSAASDPSFLLTATSADFDHYFPSYLANGYFSTMTAPRGTEGNLGYMVAFMDYGKGDIARPAAIPGWSEIDLNTGNSASGWMNAAQLDDRHFSNYSQILDMYDATLSTRYQYTDESNRTTAVQVVTMVSQAHGQLAASRLSITPASSGRVTLKFAFNLWAAQQPRFAIQSMTFPVLQQALAAQHLDLKPVNPAMPDRAAIWYHGDTNVTGATGNVRQLTLSLSGRANGGLSMAESAAIELPADLAPVSVKLVSTERELSLYVTVDLHMNTTYSFTKYVAVSRQNWSGSSADTRALAVQARRQGFERFLDEHEASWHALWKSDVLVEGDEQVQRAIHSDLYYLLSNSTVDTSWPMGACALTPNYAGHAFWDSDSWVFPALLLLHPERAKPIVMFRQRAMSAARARAKQYGVKGVMYPWEADPETGIDHTPYFAYGVWREIHVNADVAIAQWQYYLASGDQRWLRENGWPVIRAVAEFWTSRVTYHAALDRYEILHVVSPDEDYDDVNNDSFTNAAAQKALRIAASAAARLGIRADPRWTQIANKIVIPFDEQQQRHLDFDASTPHDKTTWMGSSLSWLSYPNLDLPMSQTVRRNNFLFQLSELQQHGNNPNEMMMVMLAVHAAELGEAGIAGDWIQKNLHGFLKTPFNVRSETEANNVGYILATSAGFIQSFVFGFTGLRMDDQGLSDVYAPVLAPGWTRLTLKNIHFKGRRYDIVVARDADGKTFLTRTEL